MYAIFMAYTDHAVLCRLLSKQEPSGRLMHRRLRVAKFDLEVAYKKEEAYVHVNLLSRLKTPAETIIDNDHDIPSFRPQIEESFVLDCVSDEMAKNTVECTDDGDNEQDDCDPDDYHANELITTLPDAQSSVPMFQPISQEELRTAQLSVSLCSEIGKRLSGERDAGIRLRRGRSPDLKVRNGTTNCHPVLLKDRSSTHAPLCKIGRTPCGHKLYQTIRKSIYRPALALDCYKIARC